MASRLQSVWRQTWALIKKNVTIALVRSWGWTVFRAYILPILIVVLLLEIPNFSKGSDKYGIGSPAMVKTLEQSMDGSKKLAIVQPLDLATDVQNALDRLTRPLGDDRVTRLNSSDQVWNACSVDYHGNSNCHAVLTFNDSPGSGRPNATWNYTVQVDPTKEGGGGFDVFKHDSVYEHFWLPLQVAIDNAIANSTVLPEAYSYAFGSQEKHDRQVRESFLTYVLYVLGFVFFLSMSTVVHHVSSMMASERDSGLSQLVDAMGGGVALPRVLSYVLFFDVLYLPVWIVLGSLFWYMLVPTTNPAIPIVWQILTGWATTSSAVFGTAFFRKSASAVTVVFGLAFILAAVSAVVENLSQTPAEITMVAPLSFFFPSMNYVFFLGFMVRNEMLGQPTNLSFPLPPYDKTYQLQYARQWVYHIKPYLLWIFLIVQIFCYPLLAVLVEHIFHGNNRVRRTFNRDPVGEDTHVAIETAGLALHYKPSIWRKIFCCFCCGARKPIVKAVDGLSLTSQKRQILCLLGPNGSGKTTTLDMISGFQRPTGGSVNINVPPSQIGICPQKNVLWDELTVMEHLIFWNTMKSGIVDDDDATLKNLLESCDLTRKKHTLAKNLSGGMKRKLQLACMLVGGSSVCLMDEVTSGLDPISRRVIWNVVLAERSRRTMVFTTHFLDESEVLSDHIVILSLGKMKCQGTPAELKNQYGAGYRVHLPKTADISRITYPVVDHGDRYTCTTPDSSSAAKLLATLEDSKNSENFITGPTIEDVFLKVSDEPHVLSDSATEEATIHGKAKHSNSNTITYQPPTRHVTFFRQLRALLIKRILILRSQWWIYVFALAVPIVVTHFLKGFLEKFEAPKCEDLIGKTGPPSLQSSFGSSGFIIGPESANQSVMLAFNWSSPRYYSYYSSNQPTVVAGDRNNFTQYLRDNTENIRYGGVFIDNDTIPLLAIPANLGGIQLANINLFNMARLGTPIHMYAGSLRSSSSYSMGSSLIYSIFFCLVMAIYPAFFCLYPTYERRSKVRALQYSNGIRALPLWLSYMIFDMMFVLVISIICTVLVANQPTTFWGLGHLWLVQFLYGIAATLMSYIVSNFSTSQPSAIAWALLIMSVEYILSIITMVVQSTKLAGDISTLDGITYGLGLIFPIQNLLRAMYLSLNIYIVRCRGATVINDPGSFYAYGGPICLLIIQSVALFFLLLWIDGTIFKFSRAKNIQKYDEEKPSTGVSGRPDIDAESARVEASQTDLLRMLHVSKRFASTNAVEDVSLGMREGEILALLGPNGAGKTTSIDMIRGELAPTSGSIFLEGVDVHKNKRLAQTYLGVCPQFDALDLLTVDEHLKFYARCKGITDIQQDVAYVMAKVGISAHAQKLAAKLSGGQKRKLSLAIALLGSPPVLLLDEPSSAMDAASKRVLWKTLEAVAPGRSVLITTHSMEEADALATRAAIISRRLLAIGTTQELRKKHSNEYHIHLILKSAPLSSPEEMQRIRDWAVQRFSGEGSEVKFEGESLGGQVRFKVPADAVAPVQAQREGSRGAIEGDELVSPISPTEDEREGPGKSFVRYIIETLEEHKGELGLDCYSIGAATMESVFLSVVKESDVAEEEDEKTSIWRKLGFSRN